MAIQAHTVHLALAWAGLEPPQPIAHLSRRHHDRVIPSRMEQVFALAVTEDQETLQNQDIIRTIKCLTTLSLKSCVPVYTPWVTKKPPKWEVWELAQSFN